MGPEKQKRILNLATGRPPTTRRPKSITRKATRTLINTHHMLEKQRAQAIKRGDRDQELELSADISALGGLEQYQKASLQGQRNDRGGDTSKVLMTWLQQYKLSSTPEQPGLRMLEVGALDPRNACSRGGMFEMERIDLRSQAPGIQEQDFMQRPLALNDLQRFDIISLSLVLNFVPTPADRGEMLWRAASFLRSKQHQDGKAVFPAVFIVLPRACLFNSRYFSSQSLADVMTMLGFSILESKVTQKLAYSLWRLERRVDRQRLSFPKTEVCPGAKRNNFSITLRRVQSDNSDISAQRSP